MGRLIRPRVHAPTPCFKGCTRVIRWTCGQWTLCTHPSFLGLHASHQMDAWPMDVPILLHAKTYLITRRKIAWEGERHQTT